MLVRDCTTVNDLTRADRVGAYSMCKKRESEATTWVFLNEFVDVDPGAGAAGVKHDPIEHPAGVDGGGGFRDGLVNLRLGVSLRGRMQDVGYRVENLWYDFRCQVDDFGNLRVGRHAGLRDFGNRVGDLREEVVRVGGGLPVAVKVGDVAVVPVVSRFR